jgi:hypothetical protein
MKTVIRRFTIGVLLMAELFVVFYATTFVMSWLYDLDSAPLSF